MMCLITIDPENTNNNHLSLIKSLSLKSLIKSLSLKASHAVATSVNTCLSAVVKLIYLNDRPYFQPRINVICLLIGMLPYYNKRGKYLQERKHAVDGGM